MISSLEKKSLSILYLNTYGQTKLTVNKQLQIEELIKQCKCDIAHLQETHLENDSFENCSFIKNNYTIILNNSPTKYGTTSLVRNDLNVVNISFDSLGRIIMFDIENITFGNVYLEAGTASPSRASRENYTGEILPNLLVNSCSVGVIGGDWNNITDKRDATNHASSKMSPNLSKLIKVFSWNDSHRELYPDRLDYSHYYNLGATRIDRQYYWGNISVNKSIYIPVAFSDHLGLLTEVAVPFKVSRQYASGGRPNFKIKNDIARDPEFKKSVAAEMCKWKQIRDFGLDVMTWWELVVKPGIRNIAIERAREISIKKREELNMLFIKQAYAVKKLQSSISVKHLADLKYVQSLISNWYEDQSKKIQVQSRKDEFSSSESTRIYHHQLHKQHIKRSLILKLDTESGLIEGHDMCAAYLENKVRELLCHSAQLDKKAQDNLLSLVVPVFSEHDNKILELLPEPPEILEALVSSNLNASAGSDGITSLVSKECWEVLGDCVTEVIKALFRGSPPTVSMRTAIMVFSSKPKKLNSLKPNDKRRISILNCDFKLYEGLLAKRFRKLGARVLSPMQYVAGGDRTIHHGIARARDAIESASRSKIECGIGDQDYIAAFDFLVLEWVWRVLEQKGVNRTTINRLISLYANGITIPVVNNIPLQAIHDIRGSLRQGGAGSMEWFAFGIDPLLIFLDQNLSGILVSSLPVLGPPQDGEKFPLPPLEERFKAMAFCDDVKPAISSLEEFCIADRGAALFEKAAGTRLHRDPLSNKCKFLPLGKWRRTLKQEDIPTPYMRLTDTLDMVGVQLCSTWSNSRKKNGDILQQKLDTLSRSWRSGKFMPLSMRPYSANAYALSKVWFRCATVNLRESDFTSINASMKKWIYADLLLKPEELVLFRPVKFGGLGLVSVKQKSTAFLIRTFLELAASQRYLQSQFLNRLYRFHILDEDILCPPTPSYYSNDFFNNIRSALNEGRDIVRMTTRQWYQYLLDKEVLKVTDAGGRQEDVLCRVERKNPEFHWVITWEKLRLPFLSSDNISFLWKLVHDVLTTEERLHATLGNISASCRYGCEENHVANQIHCFFDCHLTYDIGQWLLKTVRIFSPNNEENILKLNVPDNSALIWTIAKTLQYSWTKRSSHQKADPTTFLASLDAELMLMAETQFKQLAEEIEILIRQVTF